MVLSPVGTGHAGAAAALSREGTQDGAGQEVVSGLLAVVWTPGNQPCFPALQVYEQELGILKAYHLQ